MGARQKMSGGAPAAPPLFHTDFAANKSSRSKTTPESRRRRFSDEFCYKRAFLQQNYPRIPAPPLLPRALRQNGRFAAKLALGAGGCATGRKMPAGSRVLAGKRGIAALLRLLSNKRTSLSGTRCRFTTPNWVAFGVVNPAIYTPLRENNPSESSLCVPAPEKALVERSLSRPGKTWHFIDGCITYICR